MTHDARNASSNFTPLRLALSLMVMVGHYRLISGMGWPLWRFAAPAIAVDSFFVVSGYLISASFDRDSNIIRYFIRRMFRIYPLYAAVILAQAAILLATAPQGVAIHIGAVIRYIVANLAFANFVQQDLGNGAMTMLHDHSLNPSLWTLKIEFGFYLILPLIWIAVKRFGWPVIWLVFSISALFQWALYNAGHPEFAKQLPGQLQFFVLGVAAYKLQGWPRLQPALAGLMAVLAVGFVFYVLRYQRIPVVYPFGLALFVVILAVKLPPIAMKTDISYGVYLLHGPIIQLSFLLGIFRLSWLGLISTSATVIVLALAAERLIEAPGVAFGRWLTGFVRTRTPDREAASDATSADAAQITIART